MIHMYLRHFTLVLIRFPQSIHATLFTTNNLFFLCMFLSFVQTLYFRDSFIKCVGELIMAPEDMLVLINRTKRNFAMEKRKY